MSTKRKDRPHGESQGPHLKRSKGGNAGKWKTPSHRAKLETLKAKGRLLEVGDVGFWVTCQRGKEGRAMEELVSICDEYGEKLYGIQPQTEGQDSGGEQDDVEASIQKELDSMKTSNKARSTDSVFDPVRANMDCVLFMKTKSPVEPCEFVRSICEDAKLVADRKQRRSRFINRLVPISLIGKATENGVEEVAKTVLAKHFQLAGEEDKSVEEQDVGHSYAIRFSSRAHNSLKREDVIKKVATLINPRHKVSLSKPDKVIIVEISQTFCGMSVVDGDWEALRKYNIRELYEAASKSQDSGEQAKDTATAV